MRIHLPVYLLFLVLWMSIFGQSQFPSIRSLLGIPLNLIPALIVYAAISHNLAVTTGFTLFAGLALDSLSGSPLGVSVPPFFVLGFLLNTQQAILLRDQRYAQMWLGAGGAAAVHLATAGILQLSARAPALSWALLWHTFLLAVFNGLVCPLIFRLFDHLQKLFEYQPVQLSTFRTDREIKRGRY